LAYGGSSLKVEYMSVASMHYCGHPFEADFRFIESACGALTAVQTDAG